VAEQRPQAAVKAMRTAIERAPGNWEYREGLAVALAAAGRDPAAAVRAAHNRNPLDPELALTARTLAAQGSAERARSARALAARIRERVDARAFGPAGAGSG
jgi:hypothetical protein